MALQVPRYENPTVSIAPVSTPQATPLGADAFGAGLAKGLNQVAQDAFSVAKEEAQKANQKALYDFRVGLDDDETKVSFGDDETEGFLSLRGEDTTKHLDAYLEDFRGKVAERKKTAVNDEQRMAFDVMTAEREKRIEAQFRRHANTEFQTSVDASQKALEESAIRNIGNYYNDDVRFAQELAVLRQTIIEDAESKGQGAEVKKFRLDTMTSKAFSERIERMMLESPLKAKEFLDENKDLMTSDDVARYEKAMKPLVTKQAGMDTALELGATLGKRDLTDVLAEARQRLKGDPEALNIAETQIKQMETERRDAIVQVQKKAAEPVYTAMAEARKAGRIPSLRDIPPGDWNQLVKTDPDKANDILKGIQTEVRVDEERRTAKVERAERRALIEEEKRRKSDQRRNFAELWGDPAALSRANVLGLVASDALSPEQGKVLEDRRTKQNQDTILSETQTINSILGAAKIKPKSEKYDKVIEYVEHRKALFQADEKRQPKSSEIAAFTREALYESDVEWTPFDKPAYKMAIDDVPKSYRTAIAAERRKRGLPITDDAVISTYVRAQQRKERK